MWSGSASLRAILFVSAVCWCVLVAAAAAPRSPYTARLVGGKENRNVFGDLIGYYVFAEAGAVVTPPPQWEIFLGTQKQAIFENVPVASRRDSVLRWYTQSQPVGAAPVRGTKRIAAGSNDRFVINDWVFPLPGRYNMLMNASLYWGANALFNISINVDRQPGRIVMTQFPAGYNGSAMVTEPQAQMQDLLGNPVRVATPVVTFTVLSGPVNYTVRGTPSAFPDATGRVQLPQVILSLPGRYVVVLVAKLTDNTTIQTPSFSFTVARALPTQIVTVTAATGVTRAVFFTTPTYRIRDQVDFSMDSRVNITLSIGLNRPTLVYTGQDTIGILSGIVSREQSGFVFAFPGLSINLPGNYEIVATLYLDGESFLQVKHGLVLADMPTFSIIDTIEVNTVSVLSVTGAQPQIQPLYLKMSNELACESSASDTAPWAVESTTVTLRNVSFVPFVSGPGKYLCIGIPTQQDFVPLLKVYEPAFDEPYPLDYTFDITGVSTCKTLTNTDEYLYRTAGWATAASGRAYGCHLSPPVSGTIAPCDCFFILACDEFRHSSFTPPNLDIGLCVCCKGWVLAIASVSTALFFVGLMHVIYKYV